MGELSGEGNNETDDSFKLDSVRGRICDLVVQNAPLDAGKLSLLYEKTYNEPIGYKELGFNKLKGLLDTISPIENINQSPVAPFLLAMRDSAETCTCRPKRYVCGIQIFLRVCLQITKVGKNPNAIVTKRTTRRRWG